MSNLPMIPQKNSSETVKRKKPLYERLAWAAVILLFEDKQADPLIKILYSKYGKYAKVKIVEKVAALEDEGFSRILLHAAKHATESEPAKKTLLTYLRECGVI